MRPNSLHYYRCAWHNLAPKIKDLTRKQLAGTMGRRILLNHLLGLSERSRKTLTAALKSVWTMGLGLPWPIDSRRDLPRPPPVMPTATPRDAVVLAFHEAMMKEARADYRLSWLIISATGISPSDLIALTGSTIVRDGQYIYICKPREKTKVPIIARLSEDVVTVLDEYIKTHPGRLFEVANSDIIGEWWHKAGRRWNVEVPNPRAMRHWVATVCRKAGMSKVASAHLMGHTQSTGTSGRDWYDQPHIEDILAEQADRLPGGPLGFVMGPKVEVVTEDAEVLTLWNRYFRGEVSILELVTLLEKLKHQRLTCFAAQI